MTSAVLGVAARMAPREVQNQQNKDRAARIAVNRIPPQSINSFSTASELCMVHSHFVK
jgi:uncharacterized protein YeaO (DUF488 family)